MAITDDWKLKTPLVELRPVVQEDVIQLQENVMGDAEVMQYIGGTSTPKQVERFVAWIRSRYEQGDLGWFAVQPSPDSPLQQVVPSFLGLACLKPFSPDLQQTFGEHIEVGYWLAKAAWGHGVATAAATALVRYGFEELRLPEIVGVANGKNIASNKVLQKAGLQHRKTARFKDQPVEFYTLTMKEYMASDKIGRTIFTSYR